MEGPAGTLQVRFEHGPHDASSLTHRNAFLGRDRLLQMTVRCHECTSNGLVRANFPFKAARQKHLV